MQMKISATINRLVDKQDSSVKAYASVTIDGMFAVHGLRVMETEKGRFVNMPSTSYTDRDGNKQYSDIFHAVTKSALLHDTLFFDFVYEVVREKMILGSDELTDADIRIFFKNKQEQSEKVASLQDYTLHRLGSCYKTQLYEAGLLESNRANSTRKILKPILDIAFEHWLYDHDLGIMVKTLTGVR